MTPSQHIEARIAELGDWRGALLAKLRAVVKAADPHIEETWKWRGVPVWEHDGIVCTGETYKEVVKMTFAHGAELPDPKKMFNSSLEGGTRRAIDWREGDKLDDKALKALVQAAVKRNQAKPSMKAKAAAKASAPAKKAPTTKATARKPMKKAAAKPRAR